MAKKEKNNNINVNNKGIKSDDDNTKKSLFKSKRQKEKDEPRMSYDDYPFLKSVKPKESYHFHSDYFKIDNYYCSIMDFFHIKAAHDNFGAFWGVNKIPAGLPDGVTTVNFEQVQKYTEDWIIAHQSSAEGVSQMALREQDSMGTNTSKKRAQRSSADLEEIADELNNGAAYLNVHSRLLVKAPSLEVLDDAVAKIERLYLDRFATLWASPYTGDQQRDFSQLFAYNRRKKGNGFDFTSVEYAGAYSLVTHGFEDVAGEYVGDMTGEVNNSAVLFNVNNYRHHVVVGSEQINNQRNRAYVSDMWGSKLSQACLLNNGRVIHLILNNADMDNLGPKFETITNRIDMNTGDINMFEMFGDVDDELAIFPAQLKKLVLMAEQAYETTDSDRSVIRGSLEDVATKFYIDNRMWFDDAINNRDKIRIVGIPHKEVPKLEMFVTYLDMEYKALVNASARDDEKLHAFSILRTTFKNLLSNNGDLFNTITSDKIDNVRGSKRVIYDFSKLMMRGEGIAMAQLVNIVGYAVGNLGLNDLVVIHGVEKIEPTVKEYIDSVLSRLYEKGGRVAYLYSNIDKMISEKHFNQFDKADYTVLGNMSDNVVVDYQKSLGSNIPPDLANLITNKSDALCYIRRGFDNVVFRQRLILDPSEAVKKMLNQTKK